MIRETPKWTFILIGISALGFLFQYLAGPSLWILYFFPAISLTYPWMFVTSIFLHGDLSHLFFNMFALFFFGTYLERMVGRRAFVTLFLLSGIIGNVGYAFTASDLYIPAIGASGAVYGIIGALATLTPFMLVFFFYMPVPMILAAIIWGFLDFAGLFSSSSGVAHGAHLLGMFVGVIFGIYVRLKVKRQMSAI